MVLSILFGNGIIPILYGLITISYGIDPMGIEFIYLFMAKLKDLEEAIRKRAEAIGLSDEQINSILQGKYSHLSVGIWKDKRERTKKEGLQLKAYLEGKKIGLKLTTREELFRPMRELVKLYKAYKFFSEDWQEVKEILRRDLGEGKVPAHGRPDTDPTHGPKAKGR